jgi:catechol 2,3-dioxygenase-like lactoylglutathione lyase family enzyme
MQIDHLTVPVQDYEVGRRFYADALKPLGYVTLLDWPDRRRAYLGVPSGPSSLWVVESEAAGTLDVALALEDRESVIAFHNAALAAGARSLTEPSIRPEHHAGYFAARIADFDGNAIEAVCRELVAHERAAA